MKCPVIAGVRQCAFLLFFISGISLVAGFIGLARINGGFALMVLLIALPLGILLYVYDRISRRDRKTNPAVPNDSMR